MWRSIWSSILGGKNRKIVQRVVVLSDNLLVYKSLNVLYHFARRVKELGETASGV